MLLRLLMLGSCVALAGCSSLPVAGPTAKEIIQNGDNENERRYVVTDLDEKTLAIIQAHPSLTFRARFGDYRPSPDFRIGVGDAVNVQIFEAAPGGLFSSAGARPAASSGTGGGSGSTQQAASFDAQSGASSVLIPEQIVQRDGTISVPYVGRFRVVGLTPGEIQDIVQDRLAGKAIQPQVVVHQTGNRSNTVTVTGEATGGARVGLYPGGSKIMDVIAAAGGVSATTDGRGIHDTYVRLTRGNSTATVPMQTILDDPTENVFVRPDDILTLVHEARGVTAIGALGANRVVPFDRISMSLDEALAKAGGLDDNRSDAAGVFLLRFEPASLVHDLVPTRRIDGRERLIPVIYRLDLKDAKSLFIAKSFSMRDKDIIYVANASSVELQKFSSVVGTLLGSSNISGIASNIRSIRASNVVTFEPANAVSNVTAPAAPTTSATTR